MTNAFPTPREILDRFNVGARKSLGQHFLLDTNITDKIVREARINAGDLVLEIGPGPGGLTRSLLMAGAEVIAIEKDPRCVEALQPMVEAAAGKLTLVEADALRCDEATLLNGRPARVVANLPYNISTPLVYKWLDQLECFQGFSLMFQREVAERIVAKSGSKAYGKLSVVCNILCDTGLILSIPPSAFVPPPKVHSAVIMMRPRQGQERPSSEHWAALKLIAAAAFNQRRKMLRSSLKTIGDAPFVEGLLREVGIDPTTRAEQVSPAQFYALAVAYVRAKNR